MIWIVRSLTVCMAFVAMLGMASASEQAAWQALREGGVAVMRHARAPGTGDPADFRLGDCSSQRNLSDAGRDQARRIGETFRDKGVTVDRALYSRWCRARETAELAFPAQAEPEPALDSFFADRGRKGAQTAAVRQIVDRWSGPGALVLVTHQVNVTALTDVFPREGEAVVLAPDADGFRVVGRIRI